MKAFGDLEQPMLSAQEAVQTVRNVFCVGRNYREHARELGNDVPTSPLIFAKPTHALVPAAGTVRLPDGRNNVHHEVEIVLWFNQDYRSGSNFTDFVGGVALGLDLTDRDAQNRLKAAGQPWEFAKGFKNSAIISDFFGVSDWTALSATSFSLDLNGQTVQTGKPEQMIFPFQTLVDFVAEHFGLRAGDLLFTGTPAGVGPVSRGDHVELTFDRDPWAAFHFA